ncbi:MAG TPA: ATP-binding protein [Actinomycetota bacterium]|nr:ATP-binding protein [Actinomycetota bacterium]
MDMIEGAVLIVVALVSAGGGFLMARAGWFPSSSARRSDPSTAHRAEVDRERRRNEEILQRMGEGVVVLDERLKPVFANASARRLLGLPEAALPSRLPSEQLATLAWRALREGRQMDQVLDVWFPARSNLRSHVTPLEASAGVVVVLQDVTQEVMTQRMRRQFVADASHELKSPVAGLQLLAEAVREAAKDDPAAVTTFATSIVKETDRLSRLIADLLDLSRLEEAGSVATTPVELSQIARSEIASASWAARGKEIAITDSVANAVWVRGEKSQLENLVRNLLDNAVRYTPEGGRIRVVVERDGADAVLSVHDDGIGIPLEAQSRVFERFYRVDSARSRETGGTGLGLAIVKHVTELHGGSVAVDSEVGSGSTFTVRLPATKSHDNVRSIAG